MNNAQIYFAICLNFSLLSLKGSRYPILFFRNIEIIVFEVFEK